ncbi:small subunit ribosomal protein S16 [Pseudohyphozyma bogoriensis]|nr:small subunit ribosomal protein S16 [Pseudohyphozyma bogoriensis]
MVVALRLARHHNTRNAPVYSLVAISSHKRTSARPLEVLGTYDPRPAFAPPPSISPSGATRGPEWGPPQLRREHLHAVGTKTVSWNLDRVAWWISNGAQPSKAVAKLLQSAGALRRAILRITV